MTELKSGVQRIAEEQSKARHSGYDLVHDKEHGMLHLTTLFHQYATDAEYLKAAAMVASMFDLKNAIHKERNPK